jgi:hypothetical protein
VDALARNDERKNQLAQSPSANSKSAKITRKFKERENQGARKRECKSAKLKAPKRERKRQREDFFWGAQKRKLKD